MKLVIDDDLDVTARYQAILDDEDDEGDDKDWDPSKHPRVPAGSGDASGEFTEAGGDGDMHAMFDRVRQPDGGFTYNPTLHDEPKEGFALSIYPERSAAFDAEKVTFLDFVKYSARNADLLRSPKNYLGAWHDPVSHRIFLDVSMVTKDRAEAERLCREKDQIAYFDLGAMRSVDVSRSATSGGVASTHGHQTEVTEAEAAPDADHRQAERGRPRVFLREGHGQEADAAGADGSARLAQASEDALAKFSPDQPRAPAGTTTGGQWISAGDANALQAPMEQSPVKGTGPNGRVTVEDVQRFLDSRSTGPEDFNDPEVIERTTRIAAKEFDYQMTQGNTGEHWYEGNVDQAFKETQAFIPELKNPLDRQLFSVVAGIQSQLTPVPTNWVMTAQCYEYYLANKRADGFPLLNPETGMGWGLPQKGTSLNMLNGMLKESGERGTLRYLFSEHSVKELNDLRGRYGLGPKVTGSADTKRLGIEVFGPKVGPFVMSMNGIGDTSVAVDRWAVRTFHRYWGRAQGDDAPTDPERRAITRTINRVAASKNVPARQVQAALWVYEQKLYTNLGVRNDEGKTFVDGARAYAKRRRRH